MQRFAAYFIASSTATGRLKNAFINAVFFSIVYYECISYEDGWRLCVFVAVKNGVKNSAWQQSLFYTSISNRDLVNRDLVNCDLV